MDLLKEKFSIILPTFNEMGNIEKLVLLIEQQMKPFSHEIIVIDDDSPDGTSKIAMDLKKKVQSLRVIVRKKNHGLALSIKKGIENAKGSIIIIMDADLSHPPKYIPELIANLENNDMVIASRFISGGKMIYDNNIQVYASKMINFFVRFFLRLNLKDVTGGFFSTRKSTFEKINLKLVFSHYGDYFFHMMYLLKKHNLRIKEIPFVYQPRHTGKSKTRLIKVGVLYVKQVFRILLGTG